MDRIVSECNKEITSSAYSSAAWLSSCLVNHCDVSRAGKGAGDFLSWEHKMLRFIEREGYDVAYTTNIAVHENPN